MKSGLSILLLSLLAIELSAKGLMLSEIVQLKNELKDTIDSQKNKLKERKLSESKHRFIDNGLSKKSKPVHRVDRYLKPVKARYLADAVHPQVSSPVPKKGQLVKPLTLKAKPFTVSSPSLSVPLPKAAKLDSKSANRDLAQKKKFSSFAARKQRVATHTKTSSVVKKLVLTKNNKPNKKLLQRSSLTKAFAAKKLLNVVHQTHANKQAITQKYARLQALKHKQLAVRKALRSKHLNKNIKVAHLKKQKRVSALKGKKHISKKRFVVKKRTVVKHHTIRKRSRHLSSGLNQKDDQLIAALSKKVQTIKEQNSQVDLKAKAAPASDAQASALQKVPETAPHAAAPQRKLKTSTNKERTLLDLPSQNEFYSQMVDQYSDKF